MGVGEASRTGRFLSQKVSRREVWESRRILGAVGGSEVGGKPQWDRRGELGENLESGRL